MDKKILGEKLKYLRDVEDLSMDKLASNFNGKYSTNISKSMISSWENGRYLISPKNLNIYRDYFKVPPFYFEVDEIRAEDFQKIKKGNYDEYTHYVLAYGRPELDKFTDIWLDEKYQEYQSKEMIKDDIEYFMHKLNTDGYKKILDYAKDLSRINTYLDSEFLRDDQE